jgi:hypothetical protein
MGTFTADLSKSAPSTVTISESLRYFPEFEAAFRTPWGDQLNL